MFFIHVKIMIRSCPCSCREAKKDFGTIDLQKTHDVNVITTVRKANVRLVHNTCKTEVRCLQASHVASANSSLNFVRDTYDPHVKRPIVLRCTLNHFNTIFFRYDQPQKHRLTKRVAHAQSPNTYGELWQNSPRWKYFYKNRYISLEANFTFTTAKDAFICFINYLYYSFDFKKNAGTFLIQLYM